MSETPSSLDLFLAELKRRKVYRVAAAYAAVGFVLWQAAEIAVPALGLPEWVLTFVVVGTLVGFPVAVVLAWFFEVRREEDPEVGEAISASQLLGDAALRRRFVVLFGAGAAVVILTAVVVTVVGPPGATAAILQEGDRVVLADFQSNTGDDELAATVRAAFQIDLSQSDYFAPVPAAAVNDALRRMEREPTGPLTPEVAREIALRDGYPATLEGQVDGAGSGWIFSVQLVAAMTGEILVSEREAVSGEADVLLAIDRLSGRLREQVGESLARVEAAQPLPQVTTQSLDALAAYARGLDAFQKTVDFDAIELHLQEAIRLDSTFALAHSLLAGMYGNSGRSDRAVEHQTIAYRLRDRLPPVNRLLVTSGYHYRVTGDLDAAETAIRTVVEEFPGFPPGALVVLSATQMRTHQTAAAESSLVRLRDMTGSLTVSQAYNLVSVQLSLGKAEAALATADEFEAVTGIAGPRARAYFVLRRWDEADSILNAVMDDGPGGRSTKAWHTSLIALVRGQLSEFERLGRERVDLLGDDRSVMLDQAFLHANARLITARDTSIARSALAGVYKELSDLLSNAPSERARLADLLAAAGDTATANELIRSWPAEDGPPIAGQRRIETAHARVVFARGLADEAIRDLQRIAVAPAIAFGCGNCADVALAEILDAEGKTTEAIAQYEGVVEEGVIFGPFREIIALYVPRSHERLGQLYEELGDTAKAVEHHQAFVDLWQDADPELQPRVQAAREALERLRR